MTAKKATKAKVSAPAPVSNEKQVHPNTGDIAAKFPIVGIGASAGGLAAFEAFFSGMPLNADPGMAFVLVQHLAPDHKSILTELIQRYTRMMVYEVEDGMTVQPNCAYIIPPNRDMALFNGTLQLLESPVPRGQRQPIDYFFRSLAKDQRERAICIVLSGTGSDGTSGLRAVKGEGGMVMAQSLETAAYDGMPGSAINTGLVDYILAPAAMPAQIIAFVSRIFAKTDDESKIRHPRNDNALKKMFMLLRAQVGHDFSQYKSSTINRRIERRKDLLQIAELDEYVRYLQQSPEEVEALFYDLLIGVTSFFRDSEAFAALEKQVIPKLFSNRTANDAIRVWIPGCSTGEEAYSIAILLQEQMESLKHSCKLQVFATDIDNRAIAAARSGIFPASIAIDITPERLARFFTLEPDGNSYRINKNIRDSMIFSEHNVIKDPPFSKLDLISCRNLLIYMDGELQKKIIPLFHYALNSGGYLFLGTSETVGVFSNQFSTLDSKNKLYQADNDTKKAQLAGLIRNLAITDVIHSPVKSYSATDPQQTFRELTEAALLQHSAVVGILVDNLGNILYTHGRSGLYLEPVAGETVTNNILKMAREGLRCELTIALNKAVRKNLTVECPGLKIKTNGDYTMTDLAIRPVFPLAALPEVDLYLVVLEKALVSKQTSVAAASEQERPDVVLDRRIAALKLELNVKEEYLKASNEELETANEELKSSNEEMQSMNEELQSTNEELETSKEELQSVNEELATVNAELQSKVADLSRANNDMNNGSVKKSL